MCSEVFLHSVGYYFWFTLAMMFRGFKKKKKRKLFEKILDLMNLRGCFMFHTHVYNESLDGNRLKANRH